jgi:hypothetical protein
VFPPGLRARLDNPLLKETIHALTLPPGPASRGKWKPRRRILNNGYGKQAGTPALVGGGIFDNRYSHSAAILILIFCWLVASSCH